jgi:hypothetical protein
VAVILNEVDQGLAALDLGYSSDIVFRLLMQKTAIVRKRSLVNPHFDSALCEDFFVRVLRYEDIRMEHRTTG